MYITENIRYVGVNDYAITLFERQYPTPNGMSYNSYMLLDEKTAVMDTVDAGFTEKWLHNIEKEGCGTAPDFLVLHHMEPDHSAGICAFMEKYPNAQLIASRKAFVMLEQFFGVSYTDRRIVVKEGDSICLGRHCLSFLEAPMVHWPEVIMTWESNTQTLFSADAFGKFGTTDTAEEWIPEARRYYAGIVGKYGAQVSSLLQKAKKLPLQRICPLHGPVLSENLSEYIGLYQTWADYLPECNGILIAYTSMYGNTEKAVLKLVEMLQTDNATSQKLSVRSLTECDLSHAVSDAFCYDTLVLATTTYNGGIFPRMREFITQLTERGLQNRRLAFIENGSWAPTAARLMRGMLEKQKNMDFLTPVVTIHSAPSQENYRQLKELSDKLCI